MYDSLLYPPNILSSRKQEIKENHTRYEHVCLDQSKLLNDKPGHALLLFLINDLVGTLFYFSLSINSIKIQNKLHS